MAVAVGDVYVGVVVVYLIPRGAVRNGAAGKCEFRIVKRFREDGTRGEKVSFCCDDLERSLDCGPRHLFCFGEP